MIPIVLHLELLFPVYVWYMPGIYNVYVGIIHWYILGYTMYNHQTGGLHGTSFTMYIHQVYTWYIHEYTWYII